jgi:hypothetical protein
MEPNKITSFFTSGEGSGGGLPTWAKGIIAVGGLAIAYFAVKGFIDRIKSQAENKKNKETIKQQEDEKKDLENQGMRLTYPKSQYKAWADAIENEFAGCDPFNTSIRIINEISDKLKNDLDFLELQTAFAIREYDQCGWGGNITANLPKAINDELNRFQIDKANEILKKKGIKFVWN